jgi:hypothetical protein
VEQFDHDTTIKRGRLALSGGPLIPPIAVAYELYIFDFTMFIAIGRTAEAE